jgi:hypothetical protein
LRIAPVLFLVLAAAIANESFGEATYNCRKYKTKYARSNCAEFEVIYNECLSGKSKLNITCADLQKNDFKWLAKNDIAANDKLTTAGKNVTDTATCSDSEYRIYQQYDRFLENNPSRSDTELRTIFARNVGMQPQALKNLYVRCVTRWADRNPSEVQGHLKSEIEGFAKECAQRPANDPYCKAFFGR